MLGTLYDKWDKLESVDIKEGQEFVTVRGKRIEIKLESDNKLRLSLVECANNRNEQHYEAVANIRNLLEHRRKDLAMIKRDMKELSVKLLNEDLKETEEDNLMEEIRDKKALKKNHENEIKKLEIKTTIKVDYNIVKSGLTAVLPPGLIVKPEFLPEPVCWCPHNTPQSHPVEEVIPKHEEMPLTCAEQFTASGLGLQECFSNEASFVITTRGIEGKLCNVNGNDFVVESKEVDIKWWVTPKETGMYEVAYSSAADTWECEGFSMSVSQYGRDIQGSPFSVKVARLLLEFSSYDKIASNWLDVPVNTMSSVSRARLWVNLCRKNGREVYKATGVTKCKWSQNHITSPDRQWYDDKHTNVIQLDNGDGMMIIGKKGIETELTPSDNQSTQYYRATYNSYNIIINKGWKNGSNYNHERRMIIAPGVRDHFGSLFRIGSLPSKPNSIFFSKSGFRQEQSRSWPKFRGTFRIYYVPL